MAERHLITRRTALSAAGAIAATGALAVPALAPTGQTEVQRLYPAYRRARQDMLEAQAAHGRAEDTRTGMEEAERIYYASLDAYHDREVEILDATATCRDDALTQIRVMRDCGYLNEIDFGEECVRAVRVAEGIARLLA